nr:GNAT family N-acetyltransferase [Bacillus pinisoli]
MWNHSREGWGGDSHVTTEEKVKTQEANSSNLNLYLAMENDKVVGYCGLSEYREDEGALYIPLLNVRTDYHGKKIGKQLVLKALERTVELEWPRLDLYTWPGNTKAVPLYKRCGFFWEDRDDTTHLMNFMPTVLKTEAVADFFANNSWYETSTREILTTPDGRKENDFTYYEYKWEGQHQSLRMEFERTGRGLRLIETDEYLISCEVEDFKLVSDASYKVSYRILNKTSTPLQVELQGENHKLIDFSFAQDVIVSDETTIEGSFYLRKPDEEQSNWRTHPSVITNVKINGKKAKFQMGILPKQPAKIKGTVPGSQCYLNEPGVFYLDLENNYKETATFTIHIPKMDMLELERDTFTIRMGEKGKESLSIPYKLKQFGFYAPTLRIEVQTKSGLSTQFSKALGIGFKGLGAKFSGECDQFWHVYNGLYHLYVSKFDNEIIPGRVTTDMQVTFSMFPKLGKPYSSEFSKRRPNKVEYKHESGAMSVYATYTSTDFPGLELVSVSKLYAEGLLEQSFKVRNLQETSTENDVWVYHPIYHSLYKPVLPLNHQIVEIDEQAYADYGLWNSTSLTESWLFSRHTPYSHGICWPREAKVNFESWYFYVEQSVGKIAANSEVETKPIYLSFGAYQSWEEFRDFATRKTQEKVTPVEDIVVTTKKNSKEELEISLIDQKESHFQGLIKIEYNDCNSNHSFSLEEEKRSLKQVFPMSEESLTNINARFLLNGVKANKTALALNSKGNVIVSKESRDGHEVMVVTNDYLTISASATFYPGVFSLVAHDKEWLDSSFPNLEPRAWWNPWSGGIRSSLLRVTHKSFAKEESTIAEASLLDSNNMEWKGLRISTVFQQNEEYNGLEIHQYYVMLPGESIVAHLTKFVQQTGTYFHQKKWFTETCLKPGEQLEDGWIKGSGEEEATYLAGGTEIASTLSNHVLIGSSKHPHILQFVADRENEGIETYMNKEVQSFAVWHYLNLPHGQEWLSAPSFYLAKDTVLTKDEVKQLQRIQLREV